MRWLAVLVLAGCTPPLKPPVREAYDYFYSDILASLVTHYFAGTCPPNASAQQFPAMLCSVDPYDSLVFDSPFFDSFDEAEAVLTVTPGARGPALTKLDGEHIQTWLDLEDEAGRWITPSDLGFADDGDPVYDGP